MNAKSRTILLAALLVLLGIADNARSLRWGFAYDDYVHQLVLHHPEGSTSLRPWSLYDFGLHAGPGDRFFDTGFIPWWTDSDFKLRFFRPVTSLTILLDYRLYGDWAPGYHLTSLLIFGVFLALAFRLYRDIGASPKAALWALAFLAVQDDHCFPVGWIANRNTLLAALFIVATLLAVHRHQRSGRLGYLLLAGLCCLLAFGSKESGLVVLPLAALYLLLFGRPGEGESIRGAAVRLARSPILWLLAILALAYVAFYLHAGYGTRSAMYPTPWGEPDGYLTQLLLLMPFGLASLFLGFPCDIVPALPNLTWPMLCVYVPALAGVVVVLFRAIRLTPASIFAAGWILLAILPEASPEPSDRLMTTASMGSALLIGLFFERIGSWRELLAGRRYANLGLAGLLLLIGFVAAPITTAIRSSVFAGLARTDRSFAADADIDRAAPSPRSVFLINSPSGMLALTLLPTWEVVSGDMNTRIFALQAARRPVTWVRDDARTMTLTSDATPFVDHRSERLFRTFRTPPPAGTIYRTAAFTATVVAVEPTGFRSVRFRFEKNLDDPAYRFLAWQHGRLARITPPPIGQSLVLPEVPRSSDYAP